MLYLKREEFIRKTLYAIIVTICIIFLNCKQPDKRITLKNTTDFDCKCETGLGIPSEVFIVPANSVVIKTVPFGYDINLSDEETIKYINKNGNELTIFLKPKHDIIVENSIDENCTINSSAMIKPVTVKANSSQGIIIYEFPEKLLNLKFSTNVRYTEAKIIPNENKIIIKNQAF